MSFQDSIAAAAVKEQENAAKRMVEDLERVAATTYENAKSYVNIVIVTGYAAAFTIWNFVNDMLSPLGAALIATLLSLSVAVYVLWEVGVMAIVGIQGMVFARAIQKPTTSIAEINANIARYQAIVSRLNTKLFGLWWLALIFTVIPAFAAIFILLYQLVANVWEHVPSVQAAL